MPFVITCGDEGVQLNEGTRIGLLGAGVGVEQAPEIITALKKILPNEPVIAASQENDWVKQVVEANTFEQANASMEQRVQELADQVEVGYAGILPFADPQDLEHGVRGHMVRPKGIHIGTTLSFTCGGGEQTYHLGNFVISAEWVTEFDSKEVEQVMKIQTEFYTKLAKQELKISFEMEGELGEEVAAKNRAVLEKLGYKASE